MLNPFHCQKFCTEAYCIFPIKDSRVQSLAVVKMINLLVFNVQLPNQFVNILSTLKTQSKLKVHIQDST
jgi:hypothetical protein